MIIQNKKHKCDQCGKIEEVEYMFPCGWLNIRITKFKNANENELQLEKEMCSKRCMLDFMHSVKRLK